MNACEGDLIRTRSNVIFDVKGLVHPPDKIVAFPRFIPMNQGPRQGKNGNYGKIYSLSERFKFLQENLPNLIVPDPVFGETLCEVPTTEVAEHYQPSKKMQELRESKELDGLEKKALQLAIDLKSQAGIPWSAIGISGSILAGLYTVKSDIDPVVYGTLNCRKAYAALQDLRKNQNSNFKIYTEKELLELFDFRSKDTKMSFEDFEKVENRKAFQGKYMQTDYFVRFVKNWDENTEQYGDILYKNCGYAKILATIIDDADSLFTPCTYQINNVKVLEGPKLAPIKEVVSFRGRFCEHAKNGEVIEAQGKIELVNNKKTSSEHYRLMLGNKPEDYMILSQH